MSTRILSNINESFSISVGKEKKNVYIIMFITLSCWLIWVPK